MSTAFGGRVPCARPALRTAGRGVIVNVAAPVMPEPKTRMQVEQMSQAALSIVSGASKAKDDTPEAPSQTAGALTSKDIADITKKSVEEVSPEKLP